MACEELRKKGNAVYLQACVMNVAPVITRARLLKAIVLYTQALQASRNEDARAKCCKNLGAAHRKYASSCTDTSKDGRGLDDRPLSFDIEASVEWYIAALRHGRLSRQSEAWLQNIHDTFETICKMITEENSWLLEKPAFVKKISMLFQEEVTASGPCSAFAAFHLAVAQNVFDAAVKEFEGKDSKGCRDYKRSLSLLHSCYTPIQEAEKNATVTFLKRIEALKSRVQGYKASCESRQAIAAGKKLVEESCRATDGELQHDMVISALDKFKEAAILAREGVDAEIEAEANAKIGGLYTEYLDEDELANSYFSDAIRLAKDSSEVLTARWYQKAQTAIKKFFRKKKEKRDKTTKQVEELQLIFRKRETEDFLKYVYSEHPPRGQNAKHIFDGLEREDRIRQALRHAVQHYHPDRNSAKKDEEWIVICTEVTKLLLDKLSFYTKERNAPG